MKRILAVFLILIMAVGGVAGWQTFLFLNTSPGTSSEKEIFEIAPGDAFYKVSRRLEDEGFITDTFKFKILAKLREKLTSLRVGEYELHRGMYPDEVLNIITSGRSVERSITFQEGLNKYEMALAFEEKGFGSSGEFLRWTDDREFVKQQLGAELPSLEGYLFPSTYRLTKYTGAKQFIRNMVSKFKQVYEKVQYEKTVSLNRHEAVIMASIVEKETGASFERPVISSVYHNRLRKNQRLEADPTVLYGKMVELKRFVKNITRKDLRKRTPYNTYRKKGLPFGPIANPGEAALRAALNPAQSDYFYFVSRNDGTHVFSKNYDDHRKAVRQYQKNRKAREGKSWRDLHKRKDQVTDLNE